MSGPDRKQQKAAQRADALRQNLQRRKAVRKPEKPDASGQDKPAPETDRPALSEDRHV